MLGRGDQAPDFTLPADDGSEVSLSDYRGRKVLVYFYPKDDTPGCTAQACALRDDLPRFDRVDVAVLGISTDSLESHRKFRDKYDLNFPLLADEDHAVAEAYEVWQEKKLFGRELMGVVRSTFLVDEEGRIEEAWRDVNARKHLDIVTGYLDI
ncbi:MAG: thioredoxin-dependent thiol peroxidase [Gemmatimonadota bacterium]